MISLLRGMARKGVPGVLTLDVQGVGYHVAVPLDVWENTKEGEELELLIVTYVREDRFELFGFSEASARTLFQAAINMSGVGPKLALEICSVPKYLLLSAIDAQDVKLLTSIKGVGKKTAEKLMVDLKSLVEKQPEIFADARAHPSVKGGAPFDQDAIAALTSLGYDTPTILGVLKNLPADLATSEERVAAALRSL